MQVLLVALMTALRHPSSMELNETSSQRFLECSSKLESDSADNEGTLRASFESLESKRATSDGAIYDSECPGSTEIQYIEQITGKTRREC